MTVTCLSRRLGRPRPCRRRVAPTSPSDHKRKATFTTAERCHLRCWPAALSMAPCRARAELTGCPRCSTIATVSHPAKSATPTMKPPAMVRDARSTAITACPQNVSTRRQHGGERLVRGCRDRVQQEASQLPGASTESRDHRQRRSAHRRPARKRRVVGRDAGRSAAPALPTSDRADGEDRRRSRCTTRAWIARGPEVPDRRVQR